jgi:L-seryl-tRNA(Ser) seleniumtransferase
MRAHHSNFKIIGFTEEPALVELVQAAHTSGIPVLDDLGSGALLDTAQFGLAHEPTVQESLAAGADVVCFSGDKLLGGPQAGILVGKSEFMEKIQRHPLARAIRADKLCLAALTATLFHYLKHEAEREVPVWRMIATTVEQLTECANRWRSELQCGEVSHGLSTVGGGSLPEETLPTRLLVFRLRQPNKVLAQLRALNPAIIARIDQDRVCLDPRTVLPEQEDDLLRGMKYVLADAKWDE